ncbi:UNVERIFIED_ORG: hypothetical protein ABIB19_000257 [Arthrobacter sp. UYEF10]
MLGEQVAATLDEHDLLSRWMAHYLAERMTTLESLHGKARSAAEAEIADQILRLWEHRHGAALREDPIALSESVERAIARLDPERHRPWGYYDTFEEEASPSEAETEVNTLLRTALELDRIMADLVRSLVTCASLISTEVDAQWLRVARTAGVDPLEYIRGLLDNDESEASDQSPIVAERSRIVERSKIAIELLRTVAGDTSVPGSPAVS